MTSLRNFSLTLGICFGLPWLLLLVVPAVTGQKKGPLTYDKERDGMDGFYPGKPIYRQGQLIYAREGCVQCHTQMIRPGFAGILDPWRKGWGSDQSDAPAPARQSTFRDYMSEPYAFLGVQRVGPDLANAGYRLEKLSPELIHQHLYAPQSVNDWSVMPAFRHLYVKQKIQGSGSPFALKLPRKFAPKAGYEIVPTEEAKELVKYLLSLKKDAPIPGQVVAETASKK